MVHKKTQGAAVENKTFENLWRSFSDDEEKFRRKINKKKVVKGKGSHSFLRSHFHFLI
jgi:hypothetical protein